MSTPIGRRSLRYDNKDKRAVGRRLKQIRQQRSMAVMADTYGVSVSYWSKLEGGNGSSPSLTLLKFIAYRGGIDLAWLLTGEHPDGVARDSICYSTRGPYGLPEQTMAFVDAATAATASLIIDDPRFPGEYARYKDDPELLGAMWKVKAQRAISSRIEQHGVQPPPEE